MPSDRVAVATPNALAARAGAEVAAAGGNAFDVAVAAMVVSCTTEPGICSLAGGGFATVREPGRGAVTLDGYVAMPGVGRDGPVDRGFELTTAYGGGVTLMAGHGSVATPGTPSLLVDLHRRGGVVPWPEVLAPARTIAAEGFPLGSAADLYMGHVHEGLYGWHQPSHDALHHEDGSRLVEGDVLVVPDLADTLARWQQDQDTFTTGRLAELLVGDVEANGGALGHADLQAYEVRVRDPLQVTLGDWRWSTNPPPAIGGAVLAMLLHALDGTPGPDGWTPALRARAVAAQRAVLAHRVDVLDVADDRRAAGLAAVRAVVEGGLAGLTAPSTVHVSAIDRDGRAVAITCSAGYGAGVLAPGTGVWLNNCIGERELTRRGPDGYAPGARLPSNMAPTVGSGPDGDALAVGTPGADRITTSLLHVLAGIAGGMTTQDAIDAPRVHLTRRPDGSERLDLERDADLPDDVAPDVTRELFDPHAMYFGAVSVARRRGDGSLEAAADPRRDGGVAVV